MTLQGILRFTQILAISLGLIGAATVSYKTLTGISACPSIWIIPICYVVFFAYSILLISQTLFDSQYLFFIGWVPVFVIACTGVVFEILQGNICPKSNIGIPACYISLALAIFIFAVWYYLKNTKEQIEMQNLRS